LGIPLRPPLPPLALLEPLAILLSGSAIGVIMIGGILAISSANDIAV